MFQYSWTQKHNLHLIYQIVEETSSEKIGKLYELSLILKSHACANVIFTFFSDYWLCKIPYKEISALYLLYGWPSQGIGSKCIATMRAKWFCNLWIIFGQYESWMKVWILELNDVIACN